MARKKILWLCSWYPGKTEPFNGDFIQRHARAAALFNDIYVIHIAADTTGQITGTESSVTTSGNLTEQIVYFKKSMSPWGRLTAHYRLLGLYRHAIRAYLEKNGKPDLVHVQVPIWAGVAGLWLKRRLNLPFVLTEHWGIYNEVERNNYAGKSARFKRYSKAIFREAARFTSVSRYLAEGVNRWVVKKDFSIIPNTVNTEWFRYKTKTASVFRFIHVSNMVPLKNAEGILRAFAALLARNIRAELVMVGDTDPAIRVKAAALDLPAGTLQFRGEVSYQQVAAEMQRADCLVLFSDIENSPCVISEAHCCGLPVIATNVGGIPELIDAQNGVLVPPRDEAGLSAAMEAMVTGMVNYNREKISENACNKYNYEVIGRQLDCLYDEIK